MDKAQAKTMQDAAATHEAIVSRYLWLRNLIVTGSWNLADQQNTPSLGEPARARDAIRSAVIFEIPLMLYGSIYRAADVHTCVNVAGLEWSYDPDQNPDNPPEEIVKDMPHYWESVSTAGKTLPYPQKFPFPSVWFGLDPILRLRSNQRSFFNVAEENTSAELVGFLATQEGNVWAAIRVRDPRNHPGLHLMQERSASEGCWHGPLTLTPWTIPALLEWVNDHKVVTVEEVPRGLGYKRMVQRLAKQHKRLRKLIPPPYYAVTMRDQLIEEELERRWPRRGPAPEWQHRWLVTGHDRIRVRRGPLPLDEKTEKDLLRPRQGSQNRYLIFRDSHPAGDLAKELWRRGVKPKRDDEWMAVLVSRIKDYVKGPDEKPLVPSTRRSGRSRPFSP